MPQTLDSPERVNILGVGVSAINLETGTQLVLDAIKARKKGYITVTGVHGIMESQEDLEFRKILNHSFLCTPDGMPTVWIGKATGKKEMDRVYGPDLMLEIMKRSPELGTRHFFFGGCDNVANELKDNLQSRFKGLQVVGTYEPPFRPLNTEEEVDLTEKIRESRPDIMWVGLSTPKQEKFMAQYLSKLEVQLMIGVGAAFDFHAGRVRQAPRFIQRSGLEWAYRIYREPKRLWKRYFRNNPRFVLAILLQFLGIKKYSLTTSTDKSR
jgi:N-acetylglucosaminyldiphosphoundecaprenol N-acetyl-beta-D-mannosaminyltransferase